MRFIYCIVLVAVISGCSVQGMFVPRGPLEGYSGRANAPEVVSVGDRYAMKAVLHTHTNLSHAALTPQQLVEVARSRGVKVLGIAEHDNLEVCWNKVFCFRDPSVQRMGYPVYLQQMAELQRANPDLILLAGVEVSPYAWWSGFPPFLTLHDWDVHYTVYNVENPAVLQNLPVPGDRYPPCCSYHEPTGIGRYQDFVGYVAAAGGVVFQAHPYGAAKRRFYAASSITKPHPEYIPALQHLTGFAALPLGRGQLVEPGGTWDAALLQYLDGKRQRPLWVVGDSDFHGGEQSLDAVVTWLYAARPDKSSAVEAMAQGRMVAVQQGNQPGVRVKEFGLYLPREGHPHVMCGETVRHTAATEVRFALDRPVTGLSVRLIRNGEVILVTDKTSFSVDEAVFLAAHGKAFYRVEATGDGGFVLVTNPVFREPSPNSSP